MGGGLFGTPLYLNPKCLVFSAFVLGVYWMPHAKEFTHKVVMAFVLATAAYVLMAWYDVIYDCNDRLRPTLLGWLSGAFKPKEYTDKYNELPIKYQKIIRWFDIAVLVGILGLLAYPYIRWSK
jgi:UDP-N-acetylmuramyl pentapeptide phosphotransferase/UDP-N-acetylglucosamine-1-phosphate transferase